MANPFGAWWDTHLPLILIGGLLLLLILCALDAERMASVVRQAVGMLKALLSSLTTTTRTAAAATKEALVDLAYVGLTRDPPPTPNPLVSQETQLQSRMGRHETETSLLPSASPAESGAPAPSAAAAGSEQTVLPSGSREPQPSAVSPAEPPELPERHSLIAAMVTRLLYLLVSAFTLLSALGLEIARATCVQLRCEAGNYSPIVPLSWAIGVLWVVTPSLYGTMYLETHTNLIPRSIRLFREVPSHLSQRHISWAARIGLVVNVLAVTLLYGIGQLLINGDVTFDEGVVALSALQGILVVGALLVAVPVGILGLLALITLPIFVVWLLLQLLLTGLEGLLALVDALGERFLPSVIYALAIPGKKAGLGIVVLAEQYGRYRTHRALQREAARADRRLLSSRISVDADADEAAFAPSSAFLPGNIALAPDNAPGPPLADAPYKAIGVPRVGSKAIFVGIGRWGWLFVHQVEVAIADLQAEPAILCTACVPDEGQLSQVRPSRTHALDGSVTAAHVAEAFAHEESAVDDLDRVIRRLVGVTGTHLVQLLTDGGGLAGGRLLHVAVDLLDLHLLVPTLRSLAHRVRGLRIVLQLVMSELDTSEVDEREQANLKLVLRLHQEKIITTCLLVSPVSPKVHASSQAQQIRELAQAWVAMASGHLFDRANPTIVELVDQLRDSPVIGLGTTCASVVSGRGSAGRSGSLEDIKAQCKQLIVDLLHNQDTRVMHTVNDDIRGSRSFLLIVPLLGSDLRFVPLRDSLRQTILEAAPSAMVSVVPGNGAPDGSIGTRYFVQAGVLFAVGSYQSGDSTLAGLGLGKYWQVDLNALPESFAPQSPVSSKMEPTAPTMPAQGVPPTLLAAASPNAPVQPSNSPVNSPVASPAPAASAQPDIPLSETSPVVPLVADSTNPAQEDTPKIGQEAVEGYETEERIAGPEGPPSSPLAEELEDPNEREPVAPISGDVEAAAGEEEEEDRADEKGDGTRSAGPVGAQQSVRPRRLALLQPPVTIPRTVRNGARQRQRQNDEPQAETPDGHDESSGELVQADGRGAIE